MFVKRKILLNKTISKYTEGTELDIRCDKNGIPLEKFWRDRLKESEKDGCITLITEKPKKSKPKKEKTTEDN